MRAKSTDRVCLLEGAPVITKVYKCGKREVAYDGPNLITDAAKTVILTGLYVTGVQSDPIVSLRVGTGGTLDASGLYPKTEDPTQVNLTMPVATVPVSAIPNLASYQVTFLGTIDEFSANGEMVSEVGLITASGKLFSVKNFTAIPKTTDFSIEVEWIIRYV